MKVALIGLGKMGIEMANHLLVAGHDLTVFNRTIDKAKPLEDRGATIATTPADASRHAELVLSSLLDDEAVEQVALGAEGICQTLSEGSIHVGLSTVSVALAKRLTSQHRQRGQGYIGAPVIGRPDAAREATLIIVAGGDTAEIDRARPLFDVLGRSVFVAGSEPWQASLFKLCCNFMISSMLETFGEALAAIRKAGSEPQDFVALMADFWGSPIYKNYGSLIVSGQFDPPGATLALGVKDNGLLLDAAKTLQVPMPIASLVRDQMLSAMALGYADLDWASLALVAARSACLP